MARGARSLAEEERHRVQNLPPVGRRSLMESGIRRKATRLDVIIVLAFFVALLAVLTIFLGPLIPPLLHHLPDLFTSTGK